MLGIDIAYMHAKFNHSSFSRSGDMFGAHQNLNGLRDLITPFSVVPEILLGALTFKVGHMTLTTPLLRVICHTYAGN